MYYIAFNGLAFTGFEDETELPKHITLHSVHVKTKMELYIFTHDFSDYLLIYQED